MKIVMELPGKDTPGFLKRAKLALSFNAKLRDVQGNPGIFDEMIEFLLPYVREPKNRKEAREALWDASQEEFEKAMSALSGVGESSVPPTNAGS